MIIVRSFVFNPFMENTYVLHDQATKTCMVVDPGCYESHERDALTDYISENGLKVAKVLNTHCHIDHVLGNYFVKTQYGVPLAIHTSDEATLKSVEVYAPNYGFTGYQPTLPDEYLEEGDTVQLGESTLSIIFVPGHAPGHVAFYNTGQKLCIGGDVLFKGSIGRTDLPNGDFDTLIDSIHTKMFALPDETVVYSGHGPETTIGEEKATNPFCALSKS